MPDVAALNAVPFALTTPVTVVDRVMFGVLVLFATVPFRPLAFVTVTDTTVPPPAARNAAKLETDPFHEALFSSNSINDVPEIAGCAIAEIAPAKMMSNRIIFFMCLVCVKPYACAGESARAI